MRRILQPAPPYQMAAPGVLATALVGAKLGAILCGRRRMRVDSGGLGNPHFQTDDGCERPRTRLGDLRVRRLGVRVAPGALRNPLAVAGGFACPGSRQLAGLLTCGSHAGTAAPARLAPAQCCSTNRKCSKSHAKVQIGCDPSGGVGGITWAWSMLSGSGSQAAWVRSMSRGQTATGDAPKASARHRVDPAGRRQPNPGGRRLTKGTGGRRPRD
jgi:hypothetical protein